MKYKNKTCLCIDNSLFIEWAIELSKEFGKVFYWSPWVSSFPVSNSRMVGYGVPGVTRVNDWWPLIDEIDLFFFGDIYYGSLQQHLVKLGKRVWGARMGEELELNRDAAKKHMASVGIEIGPYKVVHGMEELREFLREHKRQWVKLSTTRGDAETFFAKNYAFVEPVLDELENRLGAKKKIMEFIVEEDIPSVAEVGYDGICIDGQYPKQAMYGVEIKDKGLLLKTEKYENLPEPVRVVNDKLAATLRQYQYRGFISSEILVTKDNHYYAIDPCCRLASPPSELYQLMVSNWSEIIWEGAVGNLVEPKFKGTWGAEVMILSTWATKHWQPIQFPQEIREHVKLRNLAVIDGQYYFVPQLGDLPEIGAVVAYADTAEGAIKEVCRLAEKVEGYYIETAPEALEDAKEQMALLAKL